MIGNLSGQGTLGNAYLSDPEVVGNKYVVDTLKGGRIGNVGIDFRNGKSVAAGVHGAVVGVDFLGGEHALLVSIRPDSR
jgi:hypothetical protein